MIGWRWGKKGVKMLLLSSQCKHAHVTMTTISTTQVKQARTNMVKSGILYDFYHYLNELVTKFFQIVKQSSFTILMLTVF